MLGRLLGNHLSHIDRTSEITLAINNGSDSNNTAFSPAQETSSVMKWDFPGNSLREKWVGEIKITKYKRAADCVLFSLAHLAMSDLLLQLSC